MAQVSLKQPAPLDLDNGDPAENWKKFKQRFTLFCNASGLSGKSQAMQTSTLLHIIGDRALEVYNSFEFDSEEDKMKLSVVLEKLGNYCTFQR